MVQSHDVFRAGRSEQWTTIQWETLGIEMQECRVGQVKLFLDSEVRLEIELKSVDGSQWTVCADAVTNLVVDFDDDAPGLVPTSAAGQVDNSFVGDNGEFVLDLIEGRISFNSNRLRIVSGETLGS